MIEIYRLEGNTLLNNLSYNIFINVCDYRAISDGPNGYQQSPEESVNPSGSIWISPLNCQSSSVRN